MANRPQQQHTLVHLHRSIFFFFSNAYRVASHLYYTPPLLLHQASRTTALLSSSSSSSWNAIAAINFSIHSFISSSRYEERGRESECRYIFAVHEKSSLHLSRDTLEGNVEGTRRLNFFLAISYSMIFEWKIHLIPNEFVHSIKYRILIINFISKLLCFEF